MGRREYIKLLIAVLLIFDCNLIWTLSEYACLLCLILGDMLSEHFLLFHDGFLVHWNLQGDVDVLSKYCSSHVIERCKAEHKASQTQGVFYDSKVNYSLNHWVFLPLIYFGIFSDSSLQSGVFCLINPLCIQILHVSDAEVRETKMMGETPIIIVAVRTHILGKN